jgi:uncharacterized repeat protein (TIGR01451 family)
VTTGGALTYTVTAANAGPSEAADVTVTSQLPPGAAYQGATGINWICNAIGQQVTCTTPELAITTGVFESADLSIQATATPDRCGSAT